MKELMLLIPLGSALLLTGCAGTETEFECNATTSDTCMTMEQANEKAKAREESAAKPAAAGLPRLADGNFRTLSQVSYPLSSKLVGNDIDYGLREFRWSGTQAKKFNAITRAYYLRAAETQFPLPDNLDLPLTLRNYRVYISCCVPRKKNSTSQIVELENQIKVLRASLGGAYIPTRILDAAGLVELMRELINPDPHEMYRVPYKLDPYQDLNYQCVDDSFDMQVTAGHLKIGRLGRDGKECVTRVTNYHLECDPENHAIQSRDERHQPAAGRDAPARHWSGTDTPRRG